MVDEGLNPGEVKVEPGTARGNGTAGTPAVVGVDVLAVRAIGGAPELNSAHLGHFRFVSRQATSQFHEWIRVNGITYSYGPSAHNAHIASEKTHQMKNSQRPTSYTPLYLASLVDLVVKASHPLSRSLRSCVVTDAPGSSSYERFVLPIYQTIFVNISPNSTGVRTQQTSF